MRKVLFIVFSVVFLFGVVFTVSAKTANPNANENAQIPEISGDYAVPDKPGLRVRVFVHGQNGKRPKPTLPPAVCADPTSDAVVGSAGWKLPSANVLYKINQSSAPSSIRSSVSDFVADSFAKWTNSMSNLSARPTLVADGLTSKTRYGFDGQNIIAWGRTSGTTLGVTYIWYYTETYEVAEVDTIMNSRISWDLACSSSNYNAENIMIHELGHWYGLDDEYEASYADNTMYGYGSKGETKKISPENGDFAGLNLIYQ